METQAKYSLVGAVLLFLMVALLIALIWLSGYGIKEQTRIFLIYFRENSLYGLQKNSNVTMKGIRVGAVKDFRISPNNIEEVEVTVEIEQETPIKVDTKAIITRNLLTGLAAIELTQSSQDSPLLTTGSAKDSYPVIPEGKSEFDAIAGSIPDLMQNIATMTSRAASFFTEENRQALNNILTNLNRVTSAIAAKDREIGMLIEDSKILVNNLQKLSSKLTNLANQGEEGLSQTREEISAVLMALESAITTFEERFESVANSINVKTEIAAADFAELSAALKQASNVFTITSQQFEDPQAAVFGSPPENLGPGESK